MKHFKKKMTREEAQACVAKIKQSMAKANAELQELREARVVPNEIVTQLEAELNSVLWEPFYNDKPSLN